jgi:GLPGLI family protein
MKKAILVLACLTLRFIGYSQNPAENMSGKVTYKETVKIEIKMEGESAQYADMLPKERSSFKILYFSPEASLYLNEEKKNESEDINQGSGGMQIRMKIMQPNNKFYCDLKNNKQIEQKEFMTRMFLIEGDIKNPEWKLTGNQKLILSYPCQEAFTEESGKKTTVWFTPAIPVSSGPTGLGRLPGLILEVNTNNGERIITAVSVDKSPVDAKLLVIPKEGKKVTAEEFKKIVDEKMKEMGGEGGNGAHMIIKIQK